MKAHVSQKGFTLIELVTAIIILGILSAVALTQYTNFRAQARIANLSGLAGAISSTVTLIKAQYYAQGGTGSLITLANGNLVDVGSVGIAIGVPGGSATGIGKAIEISGYSVNYSNQAAITYTITGGPPACAITYNGSTGEVTTTALTFVNCS